MKETDSPTLPLQLWGLLPSTSTSTPAHVSQGQKDKEGTVNVMDGEGNPSVSYPNTPARPSLFQGQRRVFFTQKPCSSARDWGAGGTGWKSQAQGKTQNLRRVVASWGAPVGRGQALLGAGDQNREPTVEGEKSHRTQDGQGWAFAKGTQRGEGENGAPSSEEGYPSPMSCSHPALSPG